ncbi:MAG: cache domain-containing protein [Oscillospiraceae bacterium]
MLKLKERNTGLRVRVRRRINITVVIAIYIVASAACFVTSAIYNELKKEAVAAELSNCGTQLELWLDEKSVVTDFMASEIIDRGYDTDHEGALDFLVDCMERDEQVFDCYIGFADRTCIFGGGWAPTPDEYDPTTRAWYKDAAASEGVIITDPYTDAQTGKQVITFAEKLERDGEIVGVLARDLFIDRIAEVVNSLHIDQNGYALLSTSEGIIIVHKNQEYVPYVDGSGNDVVTNLGDVMTGYEHISLCSKMICVHSF